MAISYDTIHQSPIGANSVSPFLAGLKTINETFQQDGLNVLNEGFSEVAVNPHFYQDYITRLSEGLEPETAQHFSVMANNARTVILQESLAGISPITALSLPMMRVAFPKTAMREGLPTEPVLQPKFKVTWFRPYIVDEVGAKQYLPASVKAKQSLFKLPSLQTSAILVGAAGISGYDLLTPVGANSSLGDEIDPVFAVTEVTFKVLDASNGSAETVSVPVHFRLDTNINVVEGTATANHSDGTPNAIRIFAKLDRIKGLLDVVGLGRELVSIKIQGYITSEANNRSTQVGFDITAEEIVIGTGQPIESPINIQQMTDTMAMYNIDTTVRHLEIMSTALAQSTDLQAINFLEQQYLLSNQLQDSFNVEPPANYTLGPTAWREEMKIKIDKLVTKMMQETNFTAGSAVIFSNPIDAQVLHNVRWITTGSDSVNGVNIEYKVGQYQSGITTYKVLSSFNFAPGSFYIIFIPSQADHSTYKYFPYSFNVIRGAASPNLPNIPAIQMIKRHTFRSFNQMICKLNLLNN